MLLLCTSAQVLHQPTGNEEVRLIQDLQLVLEGGVQLLGQRQAAVRGGQRSAGSRWVRPTARAVGGGAAQAVRLPPLASSSPLLPRALAPT